MTEQVTGVALPREVGDAMTFVSQLFRILPVLAGYRHEITINQSSSTRVSRNIVRRVSVRH